LFVPDSPPPCKNSISGRGEEAASGGTYSRPGNKRLLFEARSEKSMKSFTFAAKIDRANNDTAIVSISENRFM
jgi:hypothetical protein